MLAMEAKTKIKNQKMILCQTKRLYMRPFSEADFDLLYQLHSDPEVAKTTIDNIQSAEQIKKHLSDFIAHQNKFGFSQWAIFEIGSDKFVGRAGLTKRTLNDEIGEQTEIRFAIMPQFWGKGLASEITEALIEFAKEKLKVKKLAAGCGQTNEKSARILSKFGFIYAKDIIPKGYGTTDAVKYWELTF
ncbi:MAG: N-acetyltransferase [Rickettsiaceae bacterium]|jgi:ribosomal-protein-alanine N-acetyltransferase|nr:N-acetyltransferase [Rickettsiaceae bacterium]